MLWSVEPTLFPGITFGKILSGINRDLRDQKYVQLGPGVMVLGIRIYSTQQGFRDAESLFFPL